jgi:hypothetical protein
MSAYEVRSMFVLIDYRTCLSMTMRLPQNALVERRTLAMGCRLSGGCMTTVSATAGAAASLRTGFHLLIDDELVDGEESLDLINPATGTVFARCPPREERMEREAYRGASVPHQTHDRRVA